MQKLSTNVSLMISTVAALKALMNNWRNEPESWTGSTDPCTSWVGISCSNGQVTEM
jgi:hypothetical protein